MDKKLNQDKKLKMSESKKCILTVIVLLVAAPLIINIGLLIMDIIYYRFDIVLTARGLNNEKWLEFWRDYLSVAIAFFGIYLVWDSSNKDRKRQINKDESEQYLKKLDEEKNTLVEISQCFHAGAVYKVLYQSSSATIQNSRMMLEDLRDKMDEMHVKFELLTDLSDDFERCKSCRFNPCTDKRIKKEIRDIFYEMEKHYIDMINAGENYISKIDEEQRNSVSISISEKLKYNLNSQISYMQQINYNVEEIYRRQQELMHTEQQLKELEDLKLSKEDLMEMMKPISEEIEYLTQTRPKFNRYCKAYIDLKRNHAADIMRDGNIKYFKENDAAQ